MWGFLNWSEGAVVVRLFGVMLCVSRTLGDGLLRGVVKMCTFVEVVLAAFSFLCANGCIVGEGHYVGA